LFSLLREGDIECLEVKDFPDEIFAEIFEGGSEKKEVLNPLPRLLFISSPKDTPPHNKIIVIHAGFFILLNETRARGRMIIA